MNERVMVEMLDEKDRIKSKSELEEWITYERRKYGGRFGLFAEILAVTEVGILRKHQVLLRKAEYHLNSGHKIRMLLYRYRTIRMQNKYGMHIPLNACSKGLQIMHVGPVLINGKAIVGKDCYFHINTALVAGGTNDEAPILEDGVVVGIGAVILGGVHIARNVAIGANAVVNKDVLEENIAVAGVPAHKISNRGRLEWNKKENGADTNH